MKQVRPHYNTFMTAHGHEHSCCHEDDSKKQKLWYRRPVTIWIGITLFFYGLSFFLPVLLHFRHAFNDYLAKMIGPILIGFFVGGIIDYYVPQEYISKHLASKKKRTILFATGLGFLMSACSHGILALSVELHKKGASGPAVISFLLASPWANLPITFLLLGFFGLKGILIIGCALLVALTTGFFFQVLDHYGFIEKNRHSVAVKADFSIRKDLARRFKHRVWSFENFWKDCRGIFKGMIELADMILVWLLIGMLLASFSAAFIPAHIFQNYFGPSLMGLLITMAAATILEVCSEGTAPLSFEIYKQTGALGNSFAFLMGGVVTDYTEIGIVWSRLGPRTALWMLLLTLPQVFLMALLLNLW